MNKKLIIIIIAVVMVVIVGVALYIFVFSGDRELPYVYAEYSPGDFFVTNVKEPSTRLLKVTVVLSLNTDTLGEMLKANNSVIRETILFVLRDQDEETLRAVNLDGVKTKITNALNEKLEIDNITGILFSDYAVQ
ncbi:MAG: flagellar basal body-associated FliL family protein [Oscillospiraceae bacterium]|nr:flagellar basal body-associated FliL family protein [Oscillospiraceae bacterium]